MAFYVYSCMAHACARCGCCLHSCSAHSCQSSPYITGGQVTSRGVRRNLSTGWGLQLFSRSHLDAASCPSAAARCLWRPPFVSRKAKAGQATSPCYIADLCSVLKVRQNCHNRLSQNS